MFDNVCFGVYTKLMNEIGVRFIMKIRIASNNIFGGVEIDNHELCDLRKAPDIMKYIKICQFR